MTEEWLFHNKGLLNWWFEDKWGEAVRTGLKNRLQYSGWVTPFVLEHQPQSNSINITKVTPQFPLGFDLGYDDGSNKTYPVEDYEKWFRENVTISPARKTGEYAYASRFEAPIYELTVTVNYSQTAWKRLFAGVDYQWTLQVPIEWIFLTNISSFIDPYYFDEDFSKDATILGQMLKGAEKYTLERWEREHNLPYRIVAVVGMKKDIGYTATTKSEAYGEGVIWTGDPAPNGPEIQYQQQWTVTFTPKTYYEGQKSISMEDFLNKAEVKP